jgi:hypothetical protein
MSIKQVSIFVENKPGTLVVITDVLSAAGVDIRAMSIADTRDFGILRLIVSDTERAKNALTESGCIVSVTEVVAVSISDRPGALTDVIRTLSKNGVNIEYMYAFLTSEGHSAYVVLRVADNEAASAILEQNGIALVSEEDIKKL